MDAVPNTAANRKGEDIRKIGFRNEVKSSCESPLVSFAGSGVAGFFHGDVSKKNPEIPCNNYRLISWCCALELYYSKSN